MAGILFYAVGVLAIVLVINSESIANWWRRWML